MNNYANAADKVLADLTEKGCTANPSPFPKNTPVAMAYVPYQQWGQIYPAENGLERGTIFPELDKPFLGGGAYK